MNAVVKTIFTQIMGLSLLLIWSNAHAQEDLLFDADQFGDISLAYKQSTSSAIQEYEAILGASAQYEPLVIYGENSQLRRLSRSIGRLDISYGNLGMETCTASVIAMSLILTNNHCIPGTGKLGPVKAAQLVMGYYDDANPGAVKTYKVDLDPVETDADLDYAILRVEGEPAKEFGAVKILEEEAQAGSPLIVFHHPLGQRKHVTQAGCRVAPNYQPTTDQLFHACDTMPGSSGAPIFAEGGRGVIGLHFAGPGSLGPGQYNIAKRITKILEKSETLRLEAAFQEPLIRPEEPPEVLPNQVDEVLNEVLFVTDVKEIAVYREDNTTSEILGILQPGERVIVTGRINSGQDGRTWYQIVGPNGEIGYVFASLLTRGDTSTGNLESNLISKTYTLFIRTRLLCTRIDDEGPDNVVDMDPLLLRFRPVITFTDGRTTDLPWTTVWDHSGSTLAVNTKFDAAAEYSYTLDYSGEAQPDLAKSYLQYEYAMVDKDQFSEDEEARGTPRYDLPTGPPGTTINFDIKTADFTFNVDTTIALTETTGASEDVVSGATGQTEVLDARSTPPSKRAPVVSVDPATLPDFSLFRECGECPEMVIIPGGAFMMGSPNSEKGRSEHEGPQQRVTITRFAISRFETTWDQWDACVQSEYCNEAAVTVAGGDEGFGKGNRPVINVDWSDGGVFASFVNSASSGGYRIPTEAEWEYAARGNTNSAYPWGSTASHGFANYGTDDCCSGIASGRDQWVKTAPIGQFPDNAFGLYDMHGNVGEWVEDCYRTTLAGQDSGGAAYLSGGCEFRMFRGGTYAGPPSLLRSAYRGPILAANRGDGVGFRLAKTLN